MKGYCNGCNKTVQGVKKPISWGFFFLTFIIGGFIWYPLYRLLFIRRNKCQICGLKLSWRKPKEDIIQNTTQENTVQNKSSDLQGLKDLLKWIKHLFNKRK